MGPYGINTSGQQLAESEVEEDRFLAAARETFPDTDIIEVFGGYLAVPKGSVIVQATTVDGLVAKLRQQGS